VKNGNKAHVFRCYFGLMFFDSSLILSKFAGDWRMEFELQNGANENKAMNMKH